MRNRRQILRRPSRGFIASVSAAAVLLLVSSSAAGVGDATLLGGGASLAARSATPSSVRERESFIRASVLEFDPSESDTPEASRGSGDSRSPMVALFMSAVLPGWGEFYTGHEARGRCFMAAEAAIWLGYAAYRIQGAMRTDDYEEFARIFAGVQEGAGSQYHQDIGDFIRSEGRRSYNEEIRREARSLFPGDPEAQERYFRRHGYFGDDAWEWESEDRFYEYRDLKHSANLSMRNAFYMTGLAILNRAISAIDSAWMARRYNQGAGGRPGVRLSFTPEISGESWGSRATLEIPF